MRLPTIVALCWALFAVPALASCHATFLEGPCFAK